MEKKYLKEKARYAFIRERTKQLKERPRHTFDVPGRFAVQEPEQEEETSAEDQVQNTAVYTVHSTLLYAKRQHRRNTFHRETYFEDIPPQRNLGGRRPSTSPKRRPEVKPRSLSWKEIHAEKYAIRRYEVRLLSIKLCQLRNRAADLPSGAQPDTRQAARKLVRL